MASVNFKKLKGGTSAKAIFRHCASDTRLQAEHANKDINKDLTKGNLSICVRTYAELCERYDNRLAEIEKTNKNKRKDRVDCFALEIPVPDAVRDTKRFTENVLEIVSNQYGNDNVLGGFVHVDEVHGYVDADAKEYRNSLRHIHLFVTPEINGQLNGKEFSKRQNMTKLNKSIDDMTKKDFNCQFMTGTAKKSKKSVEELKNESELLMQDGIRQVYELQAELLQIITEYGSKLPENDFYEWAKNCKDSKGISVADRYEDFKRRQSERACRNNSNAIESRLNGLRSSKAVKGDKCTLESLESRLEANKKPQTINDVLREAGLPTL